MDENVSNGRSFEDMLADPHEQFDPRSELLASIAAYAAAPPASAGTTPKAEQPAPVPAAPVTEAREVRFWRERDEARKEASDLRAALGQALAALEEVITRDGTHLHVTAREAATRARAALGGGPVTGLQLHPRTMHVQRARADLTMQLIEFQRQYLLTDVEMTGMLVDAAGDVLKYVLRRERHPDDPERKADEA